MKQISATVVLFTALSGIGSTSTAVADANACKGHGRTFYQVEGTVDTKNVSSTLQVGAIHLVLKLESTNDFAFGESGSLSGQITDVREKNPHNPFDDATILSHLAAFGGSSSFLTRNDIALLVDPYVRSFDEEGEPCSFWIKETITDIVRGTGFFQNVSFIDVEADGYVSYCPNENRNSFELSGGLCIEHDLDHED